MTVMKIKRNGREIYRKVFWTKEKEFNIYCFLCGFVIAMMIAIVI